MSSFALCPTFGMFYQGFDQNGRVLSGGLLYAYESGTTTLLDTYTDFTGATANTNPIVFGSDGRPPDQIWLSTAKWYRFVLTDSLGNTIKTFDMAPSSSATVTLPGGATAGGALNQVSVTPTLVFTVQPSNVAQGAVMSPSVVVSATDGNGNVNSVFTGNITLAIGSGSSTLGGTTTVAAVAGAATFSDLTLSVEENSDTLVASSTGLTGVTSSTFNVTAPSYSSTGVTTFTSPSTMYAFAGNDAVRFPSAYSNATTAVLWNTTGTLYRINYITGATVSTQSMTGTGTFAAKWVDIDGNAFYQADSSYANIYYIQPDGTTKYFDGTAGGVVFDNITSSPSGNQTNLIVFTNGASFGEHYSSIDYVAHTATRTSLTNSPNEFAKQNANISGGRVYCTNAATAGIGYVDTATNAFVSLTTVASIDSTCMLVGPDVSIYIVGGNVIYRYDNTGSLLGSVDIGGGSKLSVVDSYGYLWAHYNNAAAGTYWWKIKVSDMSVASSGTLAQHHSSLNWLFMTNALWSDNARPVLFTSNSGTFYLGELAYA